MAEILETTALLQGRNILVDGSMRDGEWYKYHMRDLRQRFPRLRVAIIHVRALFFFRLRLPSRLTRRSSSVQFIFFAAPLPSSPVFSSCCLSFLLHFFFLRTPLLLFSLAFYFVLTLSIISHEYIYVPLLLLYFIYEL